MRSINLGRWSRRVERYFNMKGGGGLMDVEQALRMVLSFASGVEERYLEGWNRFAVVANQGAVAAQFARVRLRNPAGSNVVVVMEMLSAACAAADSPLVTWGASNTDLATLVTLAFTRMDPRGQPQPTAIVSTNAQAAGGQALLLRNVPANGNVDFISNIDQEIPVLPGQVIEIQDSVVNNNLIANLMWRERALEASELT